MKTLPVFVLVALLALAAPAAARIVVLDATSGAVVATPVLDDTKHVMAWTDDGAALLVRTPHREVLRVDVATGAATRQPQLDDAVSVGPGGRSIAARLVGRDRLRVQLRAADGRVVASPVVRSWVAEPQVAWSHDGSRVAVGTGPTLVVLDVGSGAVLQRIVSRGEIRLDAQAFSRDGSALVVEALGYIVRVNLAWRTSSVLYQMDLEDLPPYAAWAADGRIAVTTGDRIVVLGSSPVTARPGNYGMGPARWSPDAGALLYLSAVDEQGGVPRSDVELLVPGGERRVLLGPTAAPLYSADWSPDGRGVAVDLGPVPVPRPPKRYPWPRRIRHHYGMFSDRGDAAVRHLVVLVARALRHGASLDRAMDIVCTEHRRIERRFPEVGDTAVAEPLIGELNKWLRAAGLEEIDAEDQVDC